MISAVFDERWLAYTETVVRIDHPKQGRFLVAPEPGGATQGLFPNDDGTVDPHHDGAQSRTCPTRQLRTSNANSNFALAWSNRRTLEIWDAVGADVTWTHQEQSLAIIGLTDDAAREVARTFDQDAIFAWTSDRWNLLSCIDDRTWHAGWTLTATDQTRLSALRTTPS